MSKTIELPDGTPHTFTDEELERPMRDGGYSKRIAIRIREALGMVD